MKYSVKPIKNSIILKLQQSNVLPSGLVIPETAVDPNRKAVVVAVGPDAEKEGIRPGVSCVFQAHSLPPSKLEINDGEVFYVTQSSEVAAILEPEPESELLA